MRSGQPLGRAVRLMLTGILSSAALVGPAWSQDGQSSIEDLIESIDRLQDRVGLESLEINQRSEALDEAIEFRQRLIREAPDDPRRSSWHADQAEDLLLKRIEFPNSWTPHLLNADPACPMMPAEIPLIVARGLDEARA